MLLFSENDAESISVQVHETQEKSRGTVKSYNLQFYIRADHPEKAIAIATEILSDLDMKTRVFIDNTQIILINSVTSVPVPMGLDENNRHIFNVQFKMLVSRTDKLNVRA